MLANSELSITKICFAEGIEFLKLPTQEFYGIEALFRDGCGNWFNLIERPQE
jgi:hypothetical protein